MTATPLKVLMVTGAYFPEISSGGLQAQLIARAMRGRADVQVMTTAVDPTTPRHDVVEGVAVTRVHVRVGSLLSKLRAAAVMLSNLDRLVRWCDVIHVHGVSTKNVFVTLLARYYARPIVLSLHTSGADEPAAIRGSGAAAWWAFRSAARYLAVSPRLAASAVDGGIPAPLVECVPNGIDTDRFAPVAAAERESLRLAVGRALPEPAILFVGYFSHDKQPRVAFDAWMRLLSDHGIDAAAWFVGATSSEYHEVDPAIAAEMRDEAERHGRAGRLVFTGVVHDVDRYFKLADVFVLPSRREGLPVALLEAMSCALPCVASNLPGATDALITDGASGLLVPPGDVPAFAAALAAMFTDRSRAAAMGRAARRVVLDRFAAATIAERWLTAYRAVSTGPENSGPPAAG